MRAPWVVSVMIGTLMAATGASLAGAQFAYSQMSPLSAESFRTGVEAYSRGRYAEALSQFERALSDAPSDPLCLYWLGKSYYRLGVENAAFSRWTDAIAISGSSPFLESRLELGGAMADPQGEGYPERYVRVQEFMGTSGGTQLFLRPSWIEPLPDGGALIVSHGTNTVLDIDANARIRRSINAGATGLDRPFAVARQDDGTLYISEFQSDRIVRISATGQVLGYSGDQSGTGRLSGPQYLAIDKDGFLYVSDVGFARVTKYSGDGSVVLSMGQPTPAFEGLRIPTGVAVIDDTVYIADAARKEIYSFDTYGNYIGTVDTPALVRPEGLRALDDGALLLADRSRVLIIDPDTGVSRELYRSERKTPMIVSAAFDANGELLVADFDASEIAYLSDPASRFAGLSVEVGRVNSDSFPRVSFDLTVKDRYGRAITGLGSSNFYVSETVVRRESRVEGDIPVEYLASTINPVAGFSFEGGLDVSEEIDMTFMLEASPATASVLVDARDAIGSIYATLGESSSASLVIAGKTAQPAAAGSLAAISAAVLSAVGSDAWRFDSGVRLAAGSLFGSSARRVLVHIGTGSTNDNYLDGPSIAELAALLANNNISLYSVIIGKGRPSDALTYLVDRSGGAVYHADRPEGLSIIAKSVRSGRTGSYRLSFVSSADDVFGTAYLPFSVEVYLRDRSGKDETGYFAPLR